MNRLRAHLAAVDRERGVTLVEMLVYSAILVIALPFAGTMLVSAVESQRDVQAVTAAGTAVRNASRSLELGVRNASAIGYAQAGTGGDEFLVVRTQDPASAVATWICQVWFYDAARDVLYTKRAAATGATPVIGFPSSADLASWTTLAEGLTPSSGGSSILVAWPTGAYLSAQASAGARKPVVLSTSVTKRLQWQTGSAPCF